MRLLVLVTWPPNWEKASEVTVYLCNKTIGISPDLKKSQDHRGL